MTHRAAGLRALYTRAMDAFEITDVPPDPVVEAYKRDVDRTLFDRNLLLTPTERVEQLQRFVAFLFEVQLAGERQRGARNDSQAG